MISGIPIIVICYFFNKIALSFQAQVKFTDMERNNLESHQILMNQMDDQANNRSHSLVHHYQQDSIELMKT